MKNLKKSQWDQGFTLIEVMITLVVVSLSVLGILGANTLIQHKNRAMFERSMAMQEAHQVMEQIRDRTATVTTFPGDVVTAFPNNLARPGFRNLTALCGPNATPANACAWPFAFTADNTSREQVVVTYANPAGNPLDVTVTVVWKERGLRIGLQDRRAQVTLRSLIRRRPA